MSTEALKIALGSIRENPVALRAVNRQSEEYLGLVDSIKSKGFIGAISVREKKDEETSESFYELVDGLHRFSAAKDAGLEEIFVIITTLDDAASEEYQIMANVHKIETKPAEYSKQILRLLTRNPQMTESELATKLGKTPQWIQNRLSLNKIDNEAILALIDEGKIVLSNAYALAKLPEEEMQNFLTDAQTLPPTEFVPKVQQRVKQIRDAKRKGQDAGEREFSPVAFMQKMSAIREATEKADVVDAIVKATGAASASDGFKAALAWVLHLDPFSVKDQKAKYEASKAKRDEARKKKAQEKASKNKAKAEEALKKAAEAEAEIAAAEAK